MSQGTSSYDPNGCLSQQVQDGQTTKYAWNAQSFLIQTTFPNGERESYSYCGEGIRRKTQSNAGTRLFIRDGKNILLEADASNATLRRYTHMSDHWGELISLRQGSASRFYGFDGSTNTRTLTDANAGVSDAYLYSAFGEELQVTGSSVNPLRFGGEVGYYRDTMKRIYVRARHLDVGAGRWMSRDPIGFEGNDVNLYRYVGNKPVNQSDATGMQVLPSILERFASSFCPPRELPWPPAFFPRELPWPPRLSLPPLLPKLRIPQIPKLRPSVIVECIGYSGYGKCCSRIDNPPKRRCNKGTTPLDCIDQCCRNHDVCLSGPGDVLNPQNLTKCQTNLSKCASKCLKTGCNNAYFTSGSITNTTRCVAAARCVSAYASITAAAAVVNEVNSFQDFL